jgi:hypothetical protein
VEVAVDWSKLLTRFVLLILEILALGGCVAMVAAPLSAPIWLILAIAFYLRSTNHTQWSAFTTFMILQCLLIAAFGFGSWIDLRNKGYVVGPSMFRNTVGLGIVALALAATTWASRQISKSADASAARRGLSLLLQIVVIISELGIIGYLTFGSP